MGPKYIGLFIFLLISVLIVSIESDSSESDYGGPWIGIHLGTIYSSAAVSRDLRNTSNYLETRYNWKTSSEIKEYIKKTNLKNSIEIIKDEHGSVTIPTWKIFADLTNPLIDDGAAKYLATLGSEGIVVDVIRLFGKRFDDPEIQDISSPYYDVVNVDNMAYVQLKADDGETKAFNPEVMVAMILRKMKALAETQIGEKIKNAVIVVPSYFTLEQIHRINSAGELAGLKVIRVNTHQYASLWAYDFTGYHPGCNIMIYDLGGCSSEFTIITEFEFDDRLDIWDIPASKRDLNLGGESFNRRMMNYFIQLIKTKYGKDISNDREALRKINCKCEDAKRALSSQDNVKVELHSLFHDHGGIFDNSTSIIQSVETETLTRDKFEELNMDLFNRTIALSEKALEEAGLKKKDIDHILLTGGSTQIPKVRSMLMELFEGKSPMKSKDFDPFHVFPYGAAAKAGRFRKLFLEPPKEVRHYPNLNPVSVGVGTLGGVVETLIQGGSYLPLIRSKNFTTCLDHQTAVDIQIFEGVSPMTKGCKILGSLRLANISSAPRGVAQIAVTMEMNDDYDIFVTVEDMKSGNEQSLTILTDIKTQSPGWIQQKLNEIDQVNKETQVERKYTDTLDALIKLDEAPYDLKMKGLRRDSGSMHMICSRHNDENPLGLLWYRWNRMKNSWEASRSYHLPQR